MWENAPFFLGLVIIAYSITLLVEYLVKPDSPSNNEPDFQPGWEFVVRWRDGSPVIRAYDARGIFAGNFSVTGLRYTDNTLQCKLQEVVSPFGIKKVGESPLTFRVYRKEGP